jgi:hypothetical protein
MAASTIAAVKSSRGGATMIDTRREGWRAHGIEALVALYAAGEARIEPWFGEPVVDGDRSTLTL